MTWAEVTHFKNKLMYFLNGLVAILLTLGYVKTANHKSILLPPLSLFFETGEINDTWWSVSPYQFVDGMADSV